MRAQFFLTNKTKISVNLCTVLSSFDNCISSSIRIIYNNWRYLRDTLYIRNRLKVKKKIIKFVTISNLILCKIFHQWSLCRKYVQLTFHALASSISNVLARQWFAYFDCHAGIRFYATTVTVVWTPNGKLQW